jgi:hypothetical protein
VTSATPLPVFSPRDLGSGEIRRHLVHFGLRYNLRYNQGMHFADPSHPAIWLIGSFLVIVSATNLAWLAVRRRAFDPQFRSGPVAALAWLAFALFYLLFPLYGLRAGVLSLHLLGLTEIDWPATLSYGLVLAGVIVGGTVFGWLVYRRSLPEGPLPHGAPRVLSALRAPVEAALHQVHWAFYRAAAAGWLMLSLIAAPESSAPTRLTNALHAQPLYWGAWLGLAIAGAEWMLDPFSRAAMRRPGDQQTMLRRAVLAVATTCLFVLTRNLWLCLIVHTAVETLAVGWFPLPVGRLPTPEA